MAPDIARQATIKQDDGLHLPDKVLKQIPVWRKQWSELWFVRLGDKPYVYRSPTRDDTIQYDLNVHSNPAMAADQFVKECLLHPEALPDSMALGEFQELYELIWATSGRDPRAFEDKLALFDEVVRAPWQENLVLLLKSFPGLLPDTVNRWQPEKIIYHIALARVIQGMEPIKRKASRQKPAEPGEPNSPPTPAAPRERRSFDWEKDKQEHEAFMRP